MNEDRPDVPDRAHNEHELANKVRICIQEYEDDMKACFTKDGSNDPEISIAILDEAQRFATGVLKGTEELNPIPGRPDDYGLVGPELRAFAQDMENRVAELRGKLKGYEDLHWLFANDFRNMVSSSVPPDNTSLRVVWQILFAACMEETIDTVGRAATRLLQLATICIPTKPTKTTIAFLREVSRCFVWGFDLPCVVLCRSVLDVSTKDAGLKGATLKHKINGAHVSILDCEHKKKAHRVRVIGNGAVHDIACPKDDPLSIIKDTLAVLQRLTTGSGC